MDETKNGSQATTATGTAQTTTNSNTSAPVYQGENYAKAELDAVKMVVDNARVSGTLHLRSLSELADDIVGKLRDIVKSVNIPANKGGRQLGWRMPQTISPVQAAQLVFECERIRMVCTKETLQSPTAEGVLTMYVSEGPDAGIYREIGDGQVDEWCSEIAGAVNKRWKDDFYKKLHDLSSRTENRVLECEDANLIFMANGIFNYESKTLINFDPDIVALRKSATALPDTEPSEPFHVKPDGTIITFWKWIDSLVPYEGGRDILVKLAGACLRDHHNWRVMVTLFNKTGHNGKSTFLELLKTLVGPDGVMTSSLAMLAGSTDGGRFGVSNIVGVSLITCEDSDSGAYIRDKSRLKSIISHDAISVERKNKTTFDYTPHALIVCAANDIAKTKDKGQAWLDRNIYVPFTGQFVGDCDDKSIRSEWVVSEPVCEYMAYQALVKWDSYYELPEPKEAVELKEEWILDNDPVADFYETVLRNFTESDFIPSNYAWDRYVSWLKETRPSTPLPSKKAFMTHLIEIACADNEWTYPKPKTGKDGMKLSGKKWCPNLKNDNSNGKNYNGNNYNGRLRGIVRTKMWKYCLENNTTPAELGASYADIHRHLGLPEDDNEDEELICII